MVILFFACIFSSQYENFWPRKPCKKTLCVYLHTYEVKPKQYHFVSPIVMFGVNNCTIMSRKSTHPLLYRVKANERLQSRVMASGTRKCTEVVENTTDFQFHFSLCQHEGFGYQSFIMRAMN